jgi:transposase
MAKGYSKDLRVRAISIVEAGESAREAARLLNVGASTAIRWIERWTTTGSVDAKPGTGHSRRRWRSIGSGCSISLPPSRT